MSGLRGRNCGSLPYAFNATHDVLTRSRDRFSIRAGSSMTQHRGSALHACRDLWGASRSWWGEEDRPATTGPQRVSTRRTAAFSIRATGGLPGGSSSASAAVKTARAVALRERAPIRTGHRCARAYRAYRQKSKGTAGRCARAWECVLACVPWLLGARVATVSALGTDGCARRWRGATGFRACGLERRRIGARVEPTSVRM